MTSFLCLPHAARLDLLEQLTRTALSEYYGLGGGAARMEVQQYEHNAARRVTAPGRTSYVARLSVRVGNPAHQQRSEMRWLERSSTGRSGKGEFGAYEEFARAFPAGYTQVRPLPTNWARLLEPYLLLSRRLHPRLRHHSSPVNADVASWGPRRIAGIVASMQAHVAGRPCPVRLAPVWPGQHDGRA